jgi:DNA repair exonuclease SbcCD ATPase subunit
MGPQMGRAFCSLEVWKDYMTAEIQELFEEGVTRSGALTDAADQAMGLIDRMSREAEEVAERVLGKGSEACQHMRELASRLEQAEGELQAAGDQAEGAMDALGGKAAELETAAEGLRDRVKKCLDELETRQERIDDSLDAQTTTTERDFGELAAKTQEAIGEAESRLQQVGQSLVSFRSALEAARAEFAQRRQAWSQALDHLEQAARGDADHWLEALQNLLSRQSAAIVGAANAMVDHHNDAMGRLKARFVEKAPQDLAEGLGPVGGMLQTLDNWASVVHADFVTDNAHQREQEIQELGPKVADTREDFERAAAQVN